MEFPAINCLSKMHKVSYSRNATKFIKKSKKNKRLFDVFRKINKDLELGWRRLGAKKLSGDLNFLYSYSFRIGRVDYRVAFSVDEKEIYVWLAETREDFYKQLLRKVK